MFLHFINESLLASFHRGDIAFCSLECRQQHINQDERKENCSLTSIKDISTATSGSEQSSDGEMVAAAWAFEFPKGSHSYAL